MLCPLRARSDSDPGYLTVTGHCACPPSASRSPTPSNRPSSCSSSSAGSPQTPPRCPHRCWPTSATLPTDQTPSAPTRTASPSSSAAATGGPLRTRTAVTLRALPASPRDRAHPALRSFLSCVRNWQGHRVPQPDPASEQIPLLFRDFDGPRGTIDRADTSARPVDRQHPVAKVGRLAALGDAARTMLTWQYATRHPGHRRTWWPAACSTSEASSNRSVGTRTRSPS